MEGIVNNLTKKGERMKRLLIGIALVLLLASVSWGEEPITSCWNEELVPVYFCINTITGTVRFSNMTTDFRTREWRAACRANETLKVFYVIQLSDRAVDFGNLEEK